VGLVFKARRPVYHSTLGLNVIKKKKKKVWGSDLGVLPRRRSVPPASEEGSYLRLIDSLYHSTLGWRVIKKKTKFCLVQGRGFSGQGSGFSGQGRGFSG